MSTDSLGLGARLHHRVLRGLSKPEPALSRRSCVATRNQSYYDPVQAAIKACNQALSKYPKQPLFTILKAFAFDRAGNGLEATPLVQQVIDSKDADAESIHHASTILKNSGDFEKLVELYSKASARDPSDLGLHQHLFLSHVRMLEPVKQQQVWHFRCVGQTSEHACTVRACASWALHIRDVHTLRSRQRVAAYVPRRTPLATCVLLRLLHL
jgi:tetratricopeptide (TPR) repeat protein